jgi:dipeptidyl aminopeptidase/acylaminoacyl peptidase
LLCTAALALPVSATRLHVADLSKIVRLTDPEISPDGKSIVVVAGHANLDEDRTDTELILVDVASHTTRVLTRRERAGFPRLSPDGKTLAFLAADDKKNLQIWTLSLELGGDSTQLTHSPTSIEQIAWRPDGKALAFVAEDQEPERKGRAKFNDSIEIGSNDFLAHSRQMPAHLWVVDLPATTDASKMPEPKRLTSGTWSLPISLPPGPPASPVQWSPDGRAIYYVKVPTPLSGDALESSIEVLDVATGHSRPLTGATRLESAPVLSPDGSQVAYLRNQDGKAWNEQDVLLTSASGGEGKDITHKLDRNLVRAIWMPDGKSLLVGGDDATSSGFWLQPADGSPAQLIRTGDVSPTEPFWIEGSVDSHGAIAFVGTTPRGPGELFYMSPAHDAPVQLTNLNGDVASLEVAKQETLNWSSMKGGPQSDGVLTYPVGYQAGKKYPLVLYIHGGPTSNSKQAWTVYSELFAAQGWMVFEPNYRGSDNLENAYQAAIWNDAGQGPGEDVMAGLAELKKRGIVDENNIAVSGWSYGGFMTSWLLGHSTIWKASVDGAAVTNWLDMYNLSDGNITIAEGFGGSPYTSADRMKAYLDQSPISYVQNVRTPTLILCDVGDYRVPITQSYSFYRALKDHNVVTQFIAIPVGGHFPADPLRREDVMRRWIQWLGRYLPTDAGAEAAPPATTAPSSPQAE